MGFCWGCCFVGLICRVWGGVVWLSLGVCFCVGGVRGVRPGLWSSCPIYEGEWRGVGGFVFGGGGAVSEVKNSEGSNRAHGEGPVPLQWLNKTDWEELANRHRPREDAEKEARYARRELEQRI